VIEILCLGIGGASDRYKRPLLGTEGKGDRNLLTRLGEEELGK